MQRALLVGVPILLLVQLRLAGLLLARGPPAVVDCSHGRRCGLLGCGRRGLGWWCWRVLEKQRLPASDDTHQVGLLLEQLRDRLLVRQLRLEKFYQFNVSGVVVV
jgi:hypothetical protein